MATSDPSSRRTFLRTAALAATGLLGSGALGGGERLLAAVSGTGPDDPEIPNEIVAKIIQDISQGRPITRGHLSLDMPVAAEDGRVVPVIIESDLPMTPDRYVKAVHLVVDFNPDAHLAVYELSPAVGTVSLSTRIKMKRSTWVRAIAETSNGELWAAYTHVNVTLNGCG
ncbi:MAG TPA: thiosulfate oxidation carrier protein SoxY [Gemmatimonadales bacterium]|nr:thiosulfate oxidation carrier protein SoxY [Gemmatimonadales bacterium]